MIVINMKFLKSLLCFTTVLFLSAFLPACGGGGSGGGGGGSSSQFGVRVLHGAIEAPPLEFLRPGSDELLRSRFLDEAFYSDAPAGPLLVSLFTANSGGSDLVVSAPVDVEEGSRNTVFVFGDQSTLGIRTNVLRDEFSDDSTSLRVLNGVDSASSITVNISTVAGPQTVAFGSDTGYLNVGAGDLVFSAARTVDGLVVTSGTIPIAEGNSYTLLISGEAGVFVSQMLYLDS